MFAATNPQEGRSLEVVCGRFDKRRSVFTKKREGEEKGNKEERGTREDKSSCLPLSQFPLHPVAEIFP